MYLQKHDTRLTRIRKYFDAIKIGDDIHIGIETVATVEHHRFKVTGRGFDETVSGVQYSVRGTTDKGEAHIYPFTGRETVLNIVKIEKF